MPYTSIYVRVSSKSQDARSQLPDLERWAKGADVEVRWYRDQFTGTTTDRPGWRSLEADLRAGLTDRIVVWRLDRLGRSARDLTALLAELAERGVNLVSLREGLDLSTPAGRLMAHVLASVAQYETEVRSERQLAGIAAAKAKGVKFGRPAESQRPSKLTPAKRAKIVAAKNGGLAVAAIARMERVSRESVYQVLREELPELLRGPQR